MQSSSMLTMVFVMMGVFFLMIMGAWVALGVWTYRDAKARALSAGMWTAIVILVPNFIGLLLYFLVGRKQPNTRCSNCGADTPQGKPYCANCGAPLIGMENTAAPGPSTSKKPLIIAAICLLVTFIAFVGMFVALIFTNPAGFTGQNLSVGFGQTTWGQEWDLSFGYFNGRETHTFTLEPGSAAAVTVESTIQGGKLELGASVKGKPEKRIVLNDVGSPYTWDVSDLATEGKITLCLYGEDAKGSVNISCPK